MNRELAICPKAPTRTSTAQPGTLATTLTPKTSKTPKVSVRSLADQLDLDVAEEEEEEEEEEEMGEEEERAY